MALAKFKEFYPNSKELETPGWSSFYTRNHPREMLHFTRYLLKEGHDLQEDFIQNVMSIDTWKKYHYFPTLVEIRNAIVIEKFEKVRDPGDLFSSCFCNNSCHHKMIDPFGITPDEGIEMLDNMIIMGADPKQFKFRKLGVDQIDKSKYDQYARSFFR